MNKKGLLEQIPNFLSVARIMLTFVIMYMIFVNVHVVSIIVVFAFAALTDFFDGKLARRFKWESEFGRKADMIADRFLWIGTAAAFIIYFGIEGQIGWMQGIQLFFIMTREIISMPFAIISFTSGNMLPPARFIAKATTFAQGFALPALILSVYYPIFILISAPLSIFCLVTGLISAFHYMIDVQPKKIIRKEKKIKLERY